jgi:hypothetical protein
MADRGRQIPVDSGGSGKRETISIVDLPEDLIALLHQPNQVRVILTISADQIRQIG